MTPTVDTLASRGMYDVEKTPPAGGNKSRYLTATSHTGSTVNHELDSAVAAWQRLALNREQAWHKPEPPPVAEEPVRRIIQRDNGTYEVATVRRIRGVRKETNQRPTRFTKPKAAGGALVDSFYKDRDTYLTVRDEDVWAALLEVVQETRPPSKSIRSACVLLNRTLWRRAGLRTGADEPGW